MQISALFSWSVSHVHSEVVEVQNVWQLWAKLKMSIPEWNVASPIAMGGNHE